MYESGNDENCYEFGSPPRHAIPQKWKKWKKWKKRKLHFYLVWKQSKQLLNFDFVVPTVIYDRYFIAGLQP